MKVWYYQPEKAAASWPWCSCRRRAARFLPAWIWATATAPSIIPITSYATRAGFASRPLKSDGNVPNGAPQQAVLKGAREFRRRRRG